MNRYSIVKENRRIEDIFSNLILILTGVTLHSQCKSYASSSLSFPGNVTFHYYVFLSYYLSLTLPTFLIAGILLEYGDLAIVYLYLYMSKVNKSDLFSCLSCDKQGRKLDISIGSTTCASERYA